LRSLADEIETILEPLFGEAESSSSLIANQYPVTVDQQEYQIPKFLLLGQRGGGKPINTALLAGFDGGSVESVRALSEVLLQLKASLSLTRDFALTFYPVVNVRGFSDQPSPASDFEKRYAAGATADDVQFFLREFRVWSFDGLISIRTDPVPRGFYAVVRSKIIGEEVVEEAMAAAASVLPLASKPVVLAPEAPVGAIKSASMLSPRLAPPADVRHRPFDIELHLPPTDSPFDQADGLFVTITEILRHYRGLIAHARDL
jgi:hypothetical protein